MKINGVVALYKKNYLGDDRYRFDYEKYIHCTFDDETGLCEDDFGNQYPYIRSVAFLNSKDVEGHNGFMPISVLNQRYNIAEEGEEGVLHLYEIDAKNRMPLVKVVYDHIRESYGTVISEIRLDEIAKKAVSFYTDYPATDDHGPLSKSSYTCKITGSYQDIATAVRAGEFDYQDLQMIFNQFKDEHQELHGLVDDLLIYLGMLEDGSLTPDLESRDPNFDISVPVDTNTVFDMMEKSQFNKDEIETLYANFYPIFEQINELMVAVQNEITHVEKEIGIGEDASEDSESLDDDEEENDEEYSLDDLRALRNQIKKYLVGQDDALKELTLELSRFKDKDFEDNVGILLTGGSGTGKTFMVQLIAKALGIPFIRVDSTELTVPGYVGRDLEEEVYRLYEAAGKDTEKAEYGIIFFDEIDKKGSNNKDDISGQGVLNHLLTLLDGTDIYAVKSTKSMMPGEEVKINTKHIIVIVAGSFPDVYIDNKKNPIGFGMEDKIDEVKEGQTPKTDVFVKKAFMSRDFMNRFPIRIRLRDITEEDFIENYNNGEDSPIKWETASFLKNGVKLSVTPEFVKGAAKKAIEEKSGFRGSKGVILTATRPALDYVKENKGDVDEVVLNEKTIENPKVFVRKKNNAIVGE